MVIVPVRKQFKELSWKNISAKFIYGLSNLL